jgi:hypothetical protein
VIAGQELTVDEVPPQRRVVVVDRGQEAAHHGLGIAHSRLEGLGHGVEKQQALGLFDRNRGYPAVAHEPAQPVVGR